MKIGLVLDTTIDSDAGVQQYFKGLARYLLKNGHDIRFLVPPSKDEGEFKGKVISFGKNIRPPGSTTIVPTGIYVGKRAVIDVLDREKFDLIHVSSPFAPFLGRLVVAHAKCPVLSSYMILSQDRLHQLLLQILGFFMRRTYKKIDTYIAMSDAAKADAEITMPGEYDVIPIGVDLERYSPDVTPIKKLKDEKLTVLYLGRLEKRKGTAYLIKAFAKVVEKNPDLQVKLVILSDGPERENLENLVTELNLKNVRFEGFIDEKLKPNYYASADLCVFPAIYGECFGVVLVEAMASGKVTLGFKNDGYGFVLRNIPELLVENKNIDELAEKMEKYLLDERLRKQYEKKCLEIAHSYNWDSVGAQVVEKYEETIVQSSGR